MIKKFFNTIFFLIVFLFLSTPFFVLVTQYFIHQYNWKSIENKNFSDQSLILTIDNKYFNEHLLFDGKEIVINGHLYDVLNYEYIPEQKKFIVKLKNDFVENFLLDTLKRFFSNNSENYFIFLLLFFIIGFGYYLFKLFISSKIKFVFINITYFSIFLKRLFPPPKI